MMLASVAGLPYEVWEIHVCRGLRVERIQPGLEVVVVHPLTVLV